MAAKAALAVAAFLASTLALPSCRKGEGLSARGTPVILVSVDTLRADHLPAYGYRAVETPNIDALRKDSVLFENAYAHVPLTLPSHTSLFTGLLPPQHGVRDNLGYALSSGPTTLAAYLKSKGYATGGAVSRSCCRTSRA
jgi:predicted AlkP superfamily pyrophosphatase or phosphodiesterase